jgi:hypothetical protein
MGKEKQVITKDDVGTVEVMPPEKPIAVKISHRLAGPRLQVIFAATDGDVRQDLSFVMTSLVDRENVKVIHEKLEKDFGTEPLVVVADIDGAGKLFARVLKCIS